MKRKSGQSPSAAVPLAERIEQLSIKRQEIIRPILEHPREYVLLSVRAMAKRLRTDPATIVRIVRGLGFGSYREFQHYLHELSLAFATSLDTMQSGGRDPSVPVHVIESLEQDLKNLQGLKNSLDAQRLVAFAKRFHEARRIVILASDLAVNLAQYLEYQISLLGLPIFAATSAGRILHLVRSVNKQDLVIAISFRRILRRHRGHVSFSTGAGV
jgi:RpiR family carbohydrate utilization transcriptional regulator